MASSDPSSFDLVSWTLGNYKYDQDKMIYIDTSTRRSSITAFKARHLVRQCIGGLLASGLQPGDCVCLYAYNHIMYPILLLGIIGAGGRFSGANPAYTSAELKHHLQITDARFLITDIQLAQKVSTTLGKSRIPESSVFLLSDTDDLHPPFTRTVSELLDHDERDWVDIATVEEAKSTTAVLLSTSGTTGLPKAAMISHYSLVTLNRLLNDTKQKPYEVSRLISLPMFHMYAFPLAHIAPLREGITTYIMQRFNPDRYLELIKTHQITETPMVPSMMRSIIHLPTIANVDLDSLRLAWCAGSPLDKATQDAMYGFLRPSARIVQVWGMTEAGYITTFLYPEVDHAGSSVGRLLPQSETRIIGEDGTVITEDHRSGEIFIRGPLVMQGYLGNEEASSEAVDADGWLKTGDIGYKDAGLYCLTGRKKEMIKVRGWQISPAELESVLLLHPAIRDAAVIGVPDPNNTGARTDEVPRAYIVTKPGCPPSEAEIKAHMSISLASYKSLDGGVAITDMIPRNAAGKVLRGVLKERAVEEVKTDFITDYIEAVGMEL